MPPVPNFIRQFRYNHPPQHSADSDRSDQYIQTSVMYCCAIKFIHKECDVSLVFRIQLIYCRVSNTEYIRHTNRKSTIINHLCSILQLWLWRVTVVIQQHYFIRPSKIWFGTFQIPVTPFDVAANLFTYLQAIHLTVYCCCVDR